MNGQRKPFVVEIKRARQLVWKERKLLAAPRSIRQLPWRAVETRQGVPIFKATPPRSSPANTGDADHRPVGAEIAPSVD